MPDGQLAKAIQSSQPIAVGRKTHSKNEILARRKIKEEALIISKQLTRFVDLEKNDEKNAFF